jgi:dipeptidyl-peptidase-4
MLWNHWFARQGFNVLVVDGRGGLYRDHTFAKAPFHAFGQYEVQDAKAIARYLDARGIPRDSRAIWGWSYGGYVVLATLTSADLFAAGAAVAPPSDWTLYDTHYTERYMGVDKRDYRASEITKKRLSRMKARFLLVHGMSDDNVLLVNSLRVIHALQAIPRAFRLMLYPGKAHSLWGNATRRHLLRTLGDFFRDALGQVQNDR